MILNYRQLAANMSNKDGKAIKKDYLIRSSYIEPNQINEISPTIKQIFDLRSKQEIQKEPMIESENFETFNYQLGEDFNQNQPQNLAFVSKYMEEFYGDILVICPVLKAMITELVTNPKPTLFHCTAGKDRTGVTGIVLMELLNFNKEDIYQEYLTIDENLIKSLKSKIESQYSMPITSEMLDLLTVKKSYIDAFYETIENEFGNFERYNEEFLQLSLSQIAQFQDYYLVKSK